MLIYTDESGRNYKYLDSVMWLILAETHNEIEELRPIVNIPNWLTYIRCKKILAEIPKCILNQTCIECEYLIGFITFLNDNRDIFPEDMFNIGITEDGDRILEFELTPSKILDNLVLDGNKSIKIISNLNTSEIIVNWTPYNIEYKRKYKQFILPIERFDSISIKMINAVTFYCMNTLLRGDYDEIETCFKSKFTEQNYI